MDLSGHQVANWLVGGLVNGAFLYSAGAAADYAFLYLSMLGVVGYALTEITHRLYWAVFTSSSQPSTNRTGILKVENWNRLVIWGLVNGILYYLLFPRVSWSYPLAVTVGIFTVSVRDIAIRILQSFKSQSVSNASAALATTASSVKNATLSIGKKPSNDIND